METKTVQLSDDTWRLLMKHKVNYGYKTLDEVINKLLKIVPALEMKK